MPVWIVTGALDTIAPVAEAREMARAFPNARVEIMERSAHLPMLEEPERFGRVLLEFSRV
jgi:pimeloyl-ACP methyl ester carboxylesterase